jgi:(2Fe-2S) ferredoxin
MSKEEHKDKSLEQIAGILGIANVQTHLFLCAGPDCCTPEEGMEAWQAVKRAVKELNPDLRNAKVYRTKVNCLRICKSGPIAVAYPQGKWFHSVTAANAPGVVAHLQNGAQGTHPLEFIAHPLPDVTDGDPAKEDAAD